MGFFDLIMRVAVISLPLVYPLFFAAAVSFQNGRSAGREERCFAMLQKCVPTASRGRRGFALGEQAVVIVALTMLGAIQSPAQPAATPTAPATTRELDASALRRSVLDPSALFMPTGATYGRGINGVSFQQSALLTVGSFQYAAWYTLDQRRVVLGRRPLGGDTWEKVVLEGSSLDRGGPRKGGVADRSAWNAHNVVSLGVCLNDGTLHLAWDMHANDLRYRVSKPGVISATGAGTVAWSPDMMLPEQNWLVSPETKETRFTYPRFLALPDGNLLLGRRFGGSGNGDYIIQTYTAAKGQPGRWDKARTIISRKGEFEDVIGKSSSRNPYLNGIDVDRAGTIYISWNWRETPNGLGNHSICFAMSRDGGLTWLNTAGDLIADPARDLAITIDSPGVALRSSDRTFNGINQQAQTVEPDGRMHILMYHRRDDAPAWKQGDSAWSTSVSAYHHYVRDPATGAWSRNVLPGKVGSRPKIACDAKGNAYAVYSLAGELVVQRATPATGFSDWRILLRDATGIGCEPLIDTRRLAEQGVLSIFAQQSAPTSDLPLGTPLEVLEIPIDQLGALPGR